MAIHWQTMYDGIHFLCGADRIRKDNERGRCLDFSCAICEGDRDKVDCPLCIARADKIEENLLYWRRADGPHART